MIRRLRIRLVIIIMAILSLLFAIVVGGINFFHYRDNAHLTKKALDTIAQYEGKLPAAGLNYPEYLFHYAFITLDQQKEIDSLTFSKEFYSEEPLRSLTAEALAQGKSFGIAGEYQYYLLLERPDGYALVFLDQTLRCVASSRLLVISFCTGIVCLLLFWLISLRLAAWIVRPVEEAFNRQKQFISDASHELKTPLSVISANAEALASDIAPNRFLSYIQSETQQMSRLVQSLLTLTRLENADPCPPETFDLSRQVLQAALPFESTAFEAGKKLSFQVQDHLHFSGYAGSIQQLVAILLDNAILYSDEGGTIRLTLGSSHGHILLDVYNTGPGVESRDKELIFQRFYRGDQARSRAAGSYGLGLAIARSIVQKHGGLIEVESEPGQFVCFHVIFP